MKEFYNVNEVAKIFNITTNKIRYYEEKGLIKPLRDNWKDKWSFDSWASSYDEDVAKDITGVKMYKNYNYILEEVFKAATNINKKDMPILDIGVGTGNLAGRFLEENYDVIGIDQSREMLNVAKQKYPKLKVRLGEFLKIPFNDKSFDVIVSTYAFHHLNNEQKVMAIKEMLRVLKDHGKIVIGDLMFKDDKDRQDIMNKLSAKQIEEIEDEYYSNIDFLINEFKKLNKKLEYVKIDYINYIIQISN